MSGFSQDDEGYIRNWAPKYLAIPECMFQGIPWQSYGDRKQWDYFAHHLLKVEPPDRTAR